MEIIENRNILQENKLFLKKLKTYNSEDRYVILESITKNVFIVKNNSEPNELIMKILDLSKSSSEMINLTVTSFRSVFHLIGDSNIQKYIEEGDYFNPEEIGKCKFPKRFSCYKDFFIVNSQVILVYEKAIGVDLRKFMDKYIERKDFIDMKTLINISYSLLTSLWIMHHYNVYHRDIKAENIIYNEDGDWSSRVKYIDFDFSCNGVIKSCRGRPGSSLYAPGLLLKSNSMNFPNESWDRMDIVSLAITIFRLYTFNNDIFIKEKIPYDSQRDLIMWINDKTERQLDNLGATFAVFIVNMFDFDTNPHKMKVPLSSIITKYEELFKDYIEDSLFEQFKKDRTKL